MLNFSFVRCVFVVIDAPSTTSLPILSLAINRLRWTFLWGVTRRQSHFGAYLRSGCVLAIPLVVHLNKDHRRCLYEFFLFLLIFALDTNVDVISSNEASRKHDSIVWRLFLSFLALVEFLLFFFKLLICTTYLMQKFDSYFRTFATGSMLVVMVVPKFKIAKFFAKFLQKDFRVLRVEIEDLVFSSII